MRSWRVLYGQLLWTLAAFRQIARSTKAFAKLFRFDSMIKTIEL